LFNVVMHHQLVIFSLRTNNIPLIKETCKHNPRCEFLYYDNEVPDHALIKLIAGV